MEEDGGGGGRRGGGGYHHISYFIKYSGAGSCQRQTQYAHEEQEKEGLTWAGKGQKERRSVNSPPNCVTV